MPPTKSPRPQPASPIRAESSPRSRRSAHAVRGRAFGAALAIPALLSVLAFAAPAPAASDPPAALAGSGQALDLVFVLDNSGSMRTHDPDHLTRQAVLDFTDTLAREARRARYDARVALVLFDEEITLALPLSPLAGESPASLLAPALAGLDFSGQRTRSADGIERALYALRAAAESRADDDARGRSDAPRARQAIVLLTDGKIDTGDPARDREAATWLREDLAAESRDAGVRIFGLAFTENADYQLLQALARKTGGRYFRAYRAEELAGVTAEILAQLAVDPGGPLRSAGARGAGSPGATARPDGAPDVPPVSAASLDPSIASSAAASAADPGATSLFVRFAWLPALVLLFAGGFWGLRMRGGDGRPAARAGRTGSAVPSAQLLDVGGVLGETGRAIPLRPGRTRIGRDAHNDLVVADDTISSEHAVIELEGGRYWLEDLRSTNGTKQGDVRLAKGQRVALKGGDHVRFADIDLMFVVAGYVPAGATVLLPSTSTPPSHWRSASRPPAEAKPAPERVERPDRAADPRPGEAYRECLDYHLARVAELSPAFGQFVARAFDEELRDALSVAASELVKTANRDDRIAERAYTHARIRYVLCGAPGGMDVAGRAYQQAHG